MAEEEKAKKYQEIEDNEILIRILTYDIPGSKKLYPGLTRIKGVSWIISNATCHKLGLKKDMKISELTKDQIKKIEDFIKEFPLPDFLKNRRSDPESGKAAHLTGPDLEMAKEFDIKRLRKMKSYKGIRHASKLPVRGQRTRSNFRKKGIAVGVKKGKGKKK
tara:strand:+ start:85 stop:570 length:486 start_codon:yes stop_codon:yes gene_type:complete